MSTSRTNRSVSGGLPRGERRPGGARPVATRGFTLVEVLVTVSVIIVLVALFGGAISAARGRTQSNTSSNAIARLDQIVSTQFRRYEMLSVSRSQLPAGITNPSAARAWHIRRNVIAADMPDRWTDVAFMAGNAAQFTSPAQQAYIATYTAANPKPTDQYGGAECLFMIVMQGGFASCLDCNNVARMKMGDKDKDGALEFWDDWNNPIDYILWAPAFQRTGDTTRFFTPIDAAFPSSGAVRAGLGMRPLIYSAGPDGEYGLERNGDKATLSRSSSSVSITGGGCGDPDETDTKTSGRPTDETKRGDNIVNVELKAQS